MSLVVLVLFPAKQGAAAEEACVQQQAGRSPPPAKAGPELACSSLHGHRSALCSPPSALLPGLEAGARRPAQHLLQQSLDGVLLLCVVPQGCKGLGHRVSGHLGNGQAHARLHSPGQLVAVLRMHAMLMGWLVLCKLAAYADGALQMSSG